MLTELVEFYGWEVLDAAIDLKCFRIEPTIPSCLTFLKKAEWARNRVEDFYLYRFKRMPQASDEELELKPRERGSPNGVLLQDPIPLTVAKAIKMRPDVPEKIGSAKKRPTYVEEEPADQEPRESTFKSRYSDSRFRK